jgi:hypothetical protein
LEKTGLDHHASSDGITHDDYKSLYNQWHQKIGSAAIGCLESAEYMHTRAALIVLSRIVSVFPTQPKIGERILKTLAPLQSEDNDRPDIRATAQGYCSQLIKARDEGMWKEENIAVTKARQEREKMKADEKKKKLAERHEEMKKETEMISRQLHEDGRDGWRQDRRDGRDERGRPWGMDPRHTRVCLFEFFVFCATWNLLYCMLFSHFLIVVIIALCSRFSIQEHLPSRQKIELKNLGSRTVALRIHDDRGWIAKHGIAIGVAGRRRVGIIRGRMVSPEPRGESEAGLQNQAKTRDVRRRNELAATLVGRLHPAEEVEALAVLTEEGVDRVGIKLNPLEF